MGWAGAVLSTIGSIIGGNQAQHQANQAQEAAATNTTAMNQINQQQQGIIGQENMAANNLMGGVNAIGTQGPNVGGMGGILQTTGNFYGNEMQNGMTQQSRDAAYGGFDASASRQMAEATAGRYGVNPNGMILDLATQQDQGRAQLGNQIAMENQGLQTQGAQGLYNTGMGGLTAAQGLYQSQLQPLQTMSGQYGAAAGQAASNYQQDMQQKAANNPFNAAVAGYTSMQAKQQATPQTYPTYNYNTQPVTQQGQGASVYGNTGNLIESQDPAGYYGNFGGMQQQPNLLSNRNYA